ncbi:hypothetical protein HYQ44_001134 [Verticillium longisporum]|nr:hypothetical protein HYQ44_001134 [Verticillium longisporum]
MGCWACSVPETSEGFDDAFVAQQHIFPSEQNADKMHRHDLKIACPLTRESASITANCEMVSRSRPATREHRRTLAIGDEPNMDNCVVISSVGAQVSLCPHAR